LPLPPRRAVRAAIAQLREEDRPPRILRELPKALDERLPGADERLTRRRALLDEREVAAHADPVDRVPERDVEDLVEIRAIRDRPPIDRAHVCDDLPPLRLVTRRDLLLVADAERIDMRIARDRRVMLDETRVALEPRLPLRVLP